MEDTKAKEFFEGVLSKTRAGRIRWQPTAEESDYIAAIGGQFTLSISSDQYGWTLLLKDQDGRALTAVRSTDDGIEPMEIRELYEAARRQALRVDDKIDLVLGELSKL
jgi:hypothetical protein